MTATARCFNEAAGIPRGRPQHGFRHGPGQRASMRPRVFPAEDPHARWQPSSARCGFNEAAGIPRGRIPYLFRGVPYLSVLVPVYIDPLGIP